MRHWSRGGARAVGAAAVASLFLGCAGHTGGAPARKPAAGVRAAGSQQVLDVAEQMLERDCMHRLGFRFWVVTPAAPGTRRDFPYAVDDVAWARAHGYGADRLAALRRAAVTDPNQRYLLSLPPTRRTALVAALNGPSPRGLTADLPNGVQVTHSDTGCTAEAERRLYGDLPAWFRATRITASLAAERVAAVRRDPRYRTARNRWARCMAAAGLPYADPQQSRAAADPQQSRAAADPERGAGRTREIRLAVSEATCALSTGLSRVAAALDHAYGARLRHRYPEAYADLARLTAAALPRARALVARG